MDKEEIDRLSFVFGVTQDDIRGIEEKYGRIHDLVAEFNHKFRVICCDSGYGHEIIDKLICFTMDMLTMGLCDEHKRSIYARMISDILSDKDRIIKEKLDRFTEDE